MISKIVTDNIANEIRLHPDESRLYFGAGTHSVDH
jgi:hypothetical protein